MLVDDDGSVLLDGGHAPEEEDELGGVVEGEPPQDHVYEELTESDVTVHHPVDQPLSVVIFVFCVDRLDRPEHTQYNY